MNSRIIDRRLALGTAVSHAQFLNELVRFAHASGFERVATLTVVDQPGGTSDFHWVDNAPPEYREVCIARNYCSQDPVLQHCKHRNVPLAWDRGRYQDSHLREQWDLQQAFGYTSGIATALHLPNGRHFALGLTSDGGLPTDEAKLWRLSADIHLFAALAYESALRLVHLGTAMHHDGACRLSKAENECLRWTLEGKTAWEVGRILSKSERSVASYLASASRKLNCINKHQAAIKALRLGLLD